MTEGIVKQSLQQIQQIVVYVVDQGRSFVRLERKMRVSYRERCEAGLVFERVLGNTCSENSFAYSTLSERPSS